MNKMLSGRRLLVVEDEMLVLMIIQDMLTDLGCTSIATAASVDGALGLIDEQEFDAAMLDLNLDGMNSLPVADALAAHGVPFVFSTGYGRAGMTEGYSDRPLLTKPFRYQELAAVVAGLFVSPTANRIRPRLVGG